MQATVSWMVFDTPLELGKLFDHRWQNNFVFFLRHVIAKGVWLVGRFDGWLLVTKSLHAVLHGPPEL